MNLKLRVNLIITLMMAFVMLLGTVMMINNAREDVRAEVDSTSLLAMQLLDVEILNYISERTNPLDGATSNGFRLNNLNNVRHLRIEFFDAYGHLVESNRFNSFSLESPPPAWFEKMMSTVSSSLKPVERVITINNEVIGKLVISPDPSYEIAEIWDDTLGLILLGLLFFFIVNAMVYWAVGRALRPLGNILDALTQIEHGQLNTRLPPFSLPELSNISSKFNAMAQTLENSMLNNHRLTTQIIRFQEDERKNIAHDLHDEIGQHLTAINIDASAILKAKTLASAHESAKAISLVAQQMMEIIRGMLMRLRPATLDQLGLHASINELIEVWKSRNRGISLSLSISGSLNRLNDTNAITVYRIIQECLTNVTKHAKARLMIIKIEQNPDFITLLIKDDGEGYDPASVKKGFGLAGMKERVEGLRGYFRIDTDLGSGVEINISLPLNPEHQE
jgi:two-component system sensor histidine kinase UhpB